MRLFLTTCALLIATLASAQNEDLRFGISLRPILPLELLDTGPISGTQASLSNTLTPRTGFNFGMFLQQRVTGSIAFETGIFMVRRNFRSVYTEPVYGTSQQLDFAFIGYEIPLQALMYVQLGEQVWMNGSAGFSLDMYPSSVSSLTSQGIDTLSFVYTVSTKRQNWVQLGLAINYGFEWRTPKNGAWYMGASYHRPFSQLGETRAELEINNVGTTVSHAVNGSYLTADLRYVFADNDRRRRP